MMSGYCPFCGEYVEDLWGGCPFCGASAEEIEAVESDTEIDDYLQLSELFMSDPDLFI